MKLRPAWKVLAGALTLAMLYCSEWEGTLHPIAPILVVPMENDIQDMFVEYAANDPEAVYVTSGAKVNDLFTALRVDTRTGRQTPAAIPLGPQSGVL